MQEDWCRAIEPFVVQKPKIVMDVLGLVHDHHVSPGTPMEIDKILNVVRQHAQHKRDTLPRPTQTLIMINECQCTL